MTTGIEKLKKMAGTGLAPAKPVKEFPAMPKELKEFGSDEFRRAMARWEREILAWAKTLNFTG